MPETQPTELPDSVTLAGVDTAAVIHPGDTVVVNLREPMRAEYRNYYDQMRNHLKTLLPGVELIVMDSAQQLTVYRPDEMAEIDQHPEFTYTVKYRDGSSEQVDADRCEEPRSGGDYTFRTIDERAVLRVPADVVRSIRCVRRKP